MAVASSEDGPRMNIEHYSKIEVIPSAGPQFS